MNADLKLRLKSQDELTDKEWSFFWELCAKFVRLTNCGGRFRIFFTEIEGDDDTAYVTYDGEIFELVLDTRIPFGTLTDYLIHEFAHIGTWFVNESNDHGPMFGVEYARLYREYLKLYERML
jgi:hypothetical protein